jgi:predicted DNA-binding transcriptional regulator YafY
LFVSSDIGPLKDLGLGRAVEDMLLKIFAALPYAHRTEVERMRQRFHIDPANWFQIVEPTPFLPILQQAVWEDRQLHITYQPVEGDVGERVIDAYALVAKANIWYLVGKKPDAEMHNYRVVRFKEIMLLDSRFQRDPNFDLALYWKESCETFEQKSLEMSPPYHTLLRVHPSALWYFPAWMEGRYQQIGSLDEEGWYTLRVTFGSRDDARSRLLGLGTGVIVVEPEALHAAILETAHAILDFHAQK